MKGHVRKKKKDHVTVNVEGHLSDIMIGKVFNPKYADPRSQVVTINIKSVSIPKTLIGMGVAINVMTKDTMLKLNPQVLLSQTTIVLQLVDRSTICIKGML